MTRNKHLLLSMVALATLWTGCRKHEAQELPPANALPLDGRGQVPAASPEPLPRSYEVRSARIAKGATLAGTLETIGLSGGRVTEIVNALVDAGFEFRKVRTDDQVRVTFKGEDVCALEYRASPAHQWLVSRHSGALVAQKRDLAVEERRVTVDVTVTSSLYESMLDAGEDPSLAVEVADVFAWDIDFYRDVRRGDRLRVVVEKMYLKNRLLRYGRVLGARYEGDVVGDRRYLLYTTNSGDSSYFDEKGNSAKKAFLKSPLKFVHITSKFGGRTHPLLGFYHQHQGVDFSAAIGTPVWSVADGTVTRAVKGDAGGGNFLFVRHANGLETGYLHLSRFAEGIRVGTRVRQKQVIAYSGNTGRSTGPHLHFAMKRGGHYINPLTQKFPRAAPLPNNELERFAAETAGVAQLLSADAFADLLPTSPPSAGPQ